MVEKQLDFSDWRRVWSEMMVRQEQGGPLQVRDGKASMDVESSTCTGRIQGPIYRCGRASGVRSHTWMDTSLASMTNRQSCFPAPVVAQAQE